MIGLAVALAAAAVAAGPPAMLVGRQDGRLVVADAAGAQVRLLWPPAGDFPSIDGGVAAASRRIGIGTATGRDQVVVWNAATGVVRRRVSNGFGPTVFDGGRRVVFLPDHDGRRDIYQGSLWTLDVASGRVRMLVRYTAARAPVRSVVTGFDGVILHHHVSRGGGRLVLGYGNDVDLFESDVWLVDTNSGATRRLTRGRRSSGPALRPDGQAVVYVRSRGAHLGPGDLGGSLRTVRADGGGDRLLLRGTATTFYTAPTWSEPGRVLALRLQRVNGRWGADLVAVAVPSGEVTPLTSGGTTQRYSTGPTGGSIAVERRSGNARLVAADGSPLATLQGPRAWLAGEHRW